MRYLKYLTEDAVSKAMDLPEPKVGGKYPPEKVKRYVSIIDAGIQAMTKREESEANDAIVADLRDKKKKWSNVKKETKPVKTKLEVPPDQQEEPPPEDQPPQQQQGDEEEPPVKESFLLYYMKESLENQKYFEKLLADLKKGKITKEEMYKKMLHTNKKR
jgi:hypothetical protein